MARIARVVKENIGLVILAVILAASYAYLRTPAGAVATDSQLAEVFAAGRPVLVELYSNT